MADRLPGWIAASVAGWLIVFVFSPLPATAQQVHCQLGQIERYNTVTKTRDCIRLRSADEVDSRRRVRQEKFGQTPRAVREQRRRVRQLQTNSINARRLAAQPRRQAIVRQRQKVQELKIRQRQLERQQIIIRQQQLGRQRQAQRQFTVEPIIPNR